MFSEAHSAFARDQLGLSPGYTITQASVNAELIDSDDVAIALGLDEEHDEPKQVRYSEVFQAVEKSTRRANLPGQQIFVVMEHPKKDTKTGVVNFMGFEKNYYL